MDKATGVSIRAAGNTAAGNAAPGNTTKKSGTAATDPAAAARDKKLRKACADFEAVMAYQMLKTMRNTVPALGPLSRFPGKDTYDMMMDQKVAEELSRRGSGLGIQDLLYRQLKGRSSP
jgi:Rod binding domain-containing protein